MKERIKRKQLSPAIGILVVISLLSGVVLLSVLINFAAYTLYCYGINIPFVQYVQYVIFIVIGIYIVRRFLTEYEYTVTKSELIVDRFLGGRQRNLLRIRLDEILSLSAQNPRKRAQQRLTFKPKKSGPVYIVYHESKKDKCAYFSPSDDMLSLLKDRIRLND